MTVEAEPIEVLRARTSVKWRTHPDDVIPMFVAEMDYPLFPAIAEALVARIRASDTGYVDGPGRVARPFAAFADRRWGWSVDPADVRITTDVSVALVETLRVAIRPGDGVIITPPVYPPFFELIPEAGGRVVEVPLAHDGSAWSLDLAGIERALADGARAVLLCSPHNPLGLVHPREVLQRLAELAAAHGALVVSDEIHAPLVHPGVDFVPYLAVSDAARATGVALHSASKAFNLAGVKCAVMVPGDDTGRGLLAGMPEEVGYRASLLGAEASAVAYADGDDWLDDTVTALAAGRDLLERLVAEHLPRAVLHPPRATFVAWLDLGAYGLGDDPAVPLLDRARVALGNGPQFGAQGAGFVRVNYACSPELLTEAVRRIAAAVA